MTRWLLIALALLFAAPAYAQDITSDRELYLEFEGNGNDSSGNGWNGTLPSSPTFTTGKFSQAFVAISSTQKKITGGNFTGASNKSACTIAAWVYPTAHNNYRMIFSQSVDNNTGLELGMSGPGQGDGDANTGVLFTASTGTPAGKVWTAANTLPLNTWSHVVGVFDGSLTGNTNRAKVYINGAQSTAAGNSGTVDATTYNFTSTPYCVGGRASSATAAYNFDGRIDEVRVYSRALTSGEVAALYAWTGQSPVPIILQLSQ